MATTCTIVVVGSPRYAGKIGQVQFADGQAVTADAGVIAYCRRRKGYQVSEVRKRAPKPAPAPVEEADTQTPATSGADTPPASTAPVAPTQDGQASE